MKQTYLFLLTVLLTSTFQAQVILEEDINPGVDNSNPANLTIYNGDLYLTADNGSTGSELFRFTSANGAELVEEVNAEGNASASNFVVFNNTLYFTANGDNRTGIDLFSFDGASVDLIELYPDQFSGLFNPLVAYDNIYYVGFDSNFTPNRLISFNGTAGGEVLGSGVESVIGGNFIDFDGGLLLYMESDNIDVGAELYFYNIDSGEFSLIKDIDQGTGGSSISQFTKLNNEIYFEAESDLWKTDGTENGTVIVQTVIDAGVSNVREFFEWNNELYFEGDNGNGDQLWKYNPTTDALTQLSFISGDNDNHDPSDYVIYDGFLYYSAEDGVDSESHLWRTDGSTVEQLNDVLISVSELGVFEDRIFFRAEEEGVTGNELYSLDPNTLSIQNLNSLSELKIYPNPTSELVRFTKDMNGSRYSLFNLSGQLVAEGVVQNNSVDVSSFKGTLLLSVNSQEQQKTFKIISN